MKEIIIYSFLSVLITSLISLIGVITLGISNRKLSKILIYLISFSAGALLADVFFHLLPHLIEEQGSFSIKISSYIFVGIIMSLILEKIIHWRHCHLPVNKKHIHHVSLMSLIGDAIHNFIDGIIIGLSYFLSIPIGIATTIAVILHEIPQEIADYGVLVYGGFSKKKALLMNMLTATTSFIGLAFALIIGSRMESLIDVLIPIAAGNFIYIACSDLIPELHKQNETKQSLAQILAFILGAMILLLMVFLE